MAEMLFKLGRSSSRRPWTVIVAWLVVVVAATVGFVLGRGELVQGFDIPGTETARVTAELQHELPDLAGGAGMVVFHTEDATPFTTRQRQQISDLAAGAKALPYVATVVDPFEAEQSRADQAQLIALGQANQSVLTPEQAAQLDQAVALMRYADAARVVSADGDTAIVNLVFTEGRLTMPSEAKAAIGDYFSQHPIDGVTADASIEISEKLPSIVTGSEIAGVVIAGVVLAVMLGTIVAAGLPVLVALLGLGIGMLITLGFSSLVQISSVTPVLGVMLGLAVGIDYALFIVNRHRHQLRRGMELHESIGLATGTAGNAVVFAGSTVLIALLGLNITGIPFLGIMGNVGALCVAIAVLMAVTLTPALLGLAGGRVVSRRLRRSHDSPPRAIKPMPTLLAVGGVLVGVAILTTLAVPALSMRLGLPDGASEAVDSTAYRAYKTVAAEFGPGVNGPLLVTARVADSSADPLAVQAEIAGRLAAVPDVAAVAPAGNSDTFFAFQVLPASGPTAEATEQLVHDLRALTLDGVTLGVAGQATGDIDISEKLADVQPLYLGLVIGLSALIMVVVFRSLLLPLAATLGFVGSLFATYGALTAVYQWGWLASVFGVHDPGPLLNFLPIIVVGVLFGLAMDYQLFLASGTREAYVHGTPARPAVIAGLRSGRAVVTAAALIMIAVFSGFVFSESVAVRQIGFGLGFGVLVDAFIVRMMIMPSLLHLLGPAAWWLPRWLDRILPRVDIEGSKLERTHPVVEAPPVLATAAAR